MRVPKMRLPCLGLNFLLLGSICSTCTGVHALEPPSHVGGVQTAAQRASRLIQRDESSPTGEARIGENGEIGRYIQIGGSPTGEARIGESWLRREKLVGRGIMEWSDNIINLVFITA
jgi:hypothetical protein